MQHVDEALLVAYADDALGPAERTEIEAHLAACAACRGRVDEERALAARSASILAHTAPVAQPLPPFTEVVRRTRRGADRPAAGAAVERRARRAPWMPLAWAASLIVALGAGWIARMMLRAPELDARVERAESMPGAADDALMSATPGAGAADAAEAGAAASAPAEPSPRPAAPVVAEGAVAPRVAPEANQAPPELADRAVADAAARTEPVAQLKVAADTGAVVAEEVPVAVAAAPPPPAPAVAGTAAGRGGTIAGRVVDAATGAPLAGAQVSIAGTGRGALTSTDGRFRLDDVPTGVQTVRLALIGYGGSDRTVRVRVDSSSTVDVALGREAVALEEITVTEERREVEPRAMPQTRQAFAARVPEVRAVDAADAVWRGTSPTQAETRGATVFRIGDLPIDSVWIAAADASWRTRVTHRSGDAVVEVIAWSATAGIAAPASGVLADDRSYIITEVDGTAVELRAPLAAVQLEELAARVRAR